MFVFKAFSDLLWGVRGQQKQYIHSPHPCVGKESSRVHLERHESISRLQLTLMEPHLPYRHFLHA